MKICKETKVREHQSAQARAPELSSQVWSRAEEVKTATLSSGGSPKSFTRFMFERGCWRLAGGD